MSFHPIHRLQLQMRMYQLSHLIIERLPAVHDYFEELDVKPVREGVRE